jgi:signal transduction histidine kinase/GAF domain-containing protein
VPSCTSRHLREHADRPEEIDLLHDSATGVITPEATAIIASARAGAERAVHDEARLAALRETGLLDSAAEPAFDRLTRLAVRLLHVPTAFFSLVDETRDFYKSACGFGDALGGSRELSGPTFCQYAIESREPLVIPDTAADPVYREVPTVRTLGVAAYVGVPIVVDGQVIGSFCVIDAVPRAWTTSEVEVLVELAASAEREIGLRAAAHLSDRQAIQLQDQTAELEQQVEEARAMSDELEVERSRLADVFAQAPSFLAVLRGPTHVFSLVNEAYYRLVGHRELVGRPVLDALPELREQRFAELLDAVLRTGEPFVGREMPLAVRSIPGAPPEQRYVDFIYLPLIEGAERVGVIAHGTDVTTSVEARQEIELLLAESEAGRDASRRAHRLADEARAAAEEANRAQAAFLGTMSHEFRTPLNAIGGYAQLLDLEIAGPLNATQREHLVRLRASNDHMLGLVNDVLDLAKLDADALQFRAETGYTGTVVAEAYSLTSLQAKARGIRLVDESVGCQVEYVGDDQRVRQVLVNLLSNAIKFSEPGTEVVSCCHTVAEAPTSTRLTGTGPWAVIEVRDRGVGIAPESQAAVFEPFKQVDGGRTRTQGGTGLGLAISRRLARAMGGDLTLESVEGVGSTFRLWLPGAAAAVGAAPQRKGLSHASGRHAQGLADIGHRLREELEAVLDAWTARLRADGGFPEASSIPGPQLEDHTLPFLANLAQSLVIVEQTGGLDSDLMADSSEIQRVTSECHGRQRLRLGWTEAQLSREYAFLADELHGRVHRYASAGSDDAALATGILTRLLVHARDAAVRAFRCGVAS